MSVRILIVDDHELLRMGLMSLLSGTGIEIVGHLGLGAETIEVVDTCRPDVVLLDVRLPDIDGLKVLAALRRERPATKVLMLSTYDNPKFVAKAHALGASGYLTKTITRAELITAIKRVNVGEELWSRSELRRISGAANISSSIEMLEEALTSREAEVLDCLTQGLANKEISRKLGIAYDTVKEHVQNLLRKLGVVDRTQAAIWAIRNKLV